jgi:lysyl-tRNA synthetase class 2
MVAASPFFARHVHADRRPRLILRNQLVAAVRRYFENEGFCEVDLPILQISPGNELHLHAFATRLETVAGKATDIYLHTSPEFASKKLLAAGESRIFTFAKVFRNRERSALHHPEFTLLEWYRRDADYEPLMRDCEALLAIATQVAGRPAFHFRGRQFEAGLPAERLSVGEAFQRHAGIDLMRLLPGGPSTRHDFAAAAATAGVRCAETDSWSDIFSRVLGERIEPHLGNGRATILYDYPLEEAALARRKPTDPRLAERFELYGCGVELANAFSELTDPCEQRQRFEASMQKRQALYGHRYPIDEDLLAALAAIDSAAGAALGFDRLAMLASGAERIDDVLWAPVASPD